MGGVLFTIRVRGGGDLLSSLAKKIRTRKRVWNKKRKYSAHSVDSFLPLPLFLAQSTSRQQLVLTHPLGTHHTCDTYDMYLTNDIGRLRVCVVVFGCVLQCVVVSCSELQCVAACCSVLQCVAVWCSVLQCVAVCCSTKRPMYMTKDIGRLHGCVVVCCSVLQCVAVCCSVLQCIGVCCSVLQCVTVCCSKERPMCMTKDIARMRVCVTVCYSVLQCVTVLCCGAQQCVASRSQLCCACTSFPATY